jgi:PAS domain S-box-containing protein
VAISIHAFPALLSASSDPIFVIGALGRLDMVNEPAASLLGRRPADVVGKSWGEMALLPAFGAIVEDLCDRAIRSSQAVHSDLAQADGTIFACRAVAQRDEAGQPVGVVLVLHDITPRRSLELDLQARQDENQLLLVEMHHRTKNNLQIVSSILRMQGWRLGDPRLRRPFEDACGRIQTLAWVHEMLHRQGNLQRIDFAACVQGLIKDVGTHYEDQRAAPPPSTVTGAMILGLDKAVPTALILHEWLVSAVGPLTIDLSGEGRITVTGTIDIAPGSLGARMVAVLVGQLRGALENRQGPPPATILVLERNDLGPVPDGGKETAKVGGGNGGGHVVA